MLTHIPSPCNPFIDPVPVTQPILTNPSATWEGTLPTGDWSATDPDETLIGFSVDRCDQIAGTEVSFKDNQTTPRDEDGQNLVSQPVTPRLPPDPTAPTPPPTVEKRSIHCSDLSCSDCCLGPYHDVLLSMQTSLVQLTAAIHKLVEQQATPARNLGPKSPCQNRNAAPTCTKPSTSPISGHNAYQSRAASQVICYNCEGKGHFSNECPSARQSNATRGPRSLPGPNSNH